MARKLDLVRRAELATRAVAALRARGVHRTTMSELAVALGLKRPTLYFYFRDLGAVFEVAFEDAQRRYLEYVARRVEGIEHPIDALCAIARTTAEYQAGQREQVLLLLQLWAVGGSDPERVLARGRELFDPLRAALVARVADGIARGVVAPCDPARVVDLVLATLDGTMTSQVVRRAAPGPVVEELIARVLEPLAVRVRSARSRAPRTPRTRSLRS
jgi:AcrR family transcriptional regulator